MLLGLKWIEVSVGYKTQSSHEDASSSCYLKVRIIECKWFVFLLPNNVGFIALLKQIVFFKISLSQLHSFKTSTSHLLCGNFSVIYILIKHLQKIFVLYSPGFPAHVFARWWFDSPNLHSILLLHKVGKIIYCSHRSLLPGFWEGTRFYLLGNFVKFRRLLLGRSTRFWQNSCWTTCSPVLWGFDHVGA